MQKLSKDLFNQLTHHLTHIISETNGIVLTDSLELLDYWTSLDGNTQIREITIDFQEKLAEFQQNKREIQDLIEHPIGQTLFEFFKSFPLPYREEHIHLTGSLSAEFIYPRLKPLLNGAHKALYEKKIKEIYGDNAWPIESVEDVDTLIRLKEDQRFEHYLKVLFLPKLILIDRQAHEEAAYHMASELFNKYNVGHIRLKFTLSRSASQSSEQIPGIGDITSEDVVLGLYQGFKKFQQENPRFNFILSPSFRKEPWFFDDDNFKTKNDHFLDQIQTLLNLLQKHSFLKEHLCEVDTVGDEKDLYKKSHFNEMKIGFRKLQYSGFKIRSHHGETWHTLRKGIQAVDNAMNIWRIDTLEHGLSLGMNPNFYFHSIFQRVSKWNSRKKPLWKGSLEYNEINDMSWGVHQSVCDKLLKGSPLSEDELTVFIKTKFHTATEIESYQHDVLNRMLSKEVSLTSLPSSNNKLTFGFEDFKDHPFSWWEQKGVSLGVGTDNYITLNTNFINEMIILLFTNPDNIKITKLLMVTTGENRRPYISQLLWQMRKKIKQSHSSTLC